MAGYELDLALLAMAVFIAINGSKMFALDQIIFKGQKTETSSFLKN
jgi:putative oxidoreductase